MTRHDEVSSRREMLGMGARSLLALSLIQHACRSGYARESERGSIEGWIHQLDQVSRRLARGDVSALQWQEELDRLYGSVPMKSLLKVIDFNKLGDRLAHRDLRGRGEIFEDIPLGPIPSQNGRWPEESATAIVKIAHVKKGRSIPPHGHSNMTSAFLCISGNFAVRLYDRLDMIDNEMVVRQTVDEKSLGPGTWSSISDYRNNVHWLTALSDDCFLFTAKLIRLEKGREFRGRININLKEAKVLGSQTYRAPIISGRRAAELY